MVDVVGAENIIFAEIAADLHLDQLERHLAGIFEAVPLRCNDIDALVLAHELVRVADGDFRRAVHDDPMLRAVVMHLHGELAARFDMQQLHLKSGTERQRLEIAPGPIAPQVLLMLLAVRPFQARNDLRNVLRARLVGDQQGIGRIDDDEVCNADRRDECFVAVHVAACRIFQNGVASADVVAAIVMRRDIPE